MTSVSSRAEEKISNDSLRSLVQASIDLQLPDPHLSLEMAKMALREEVADRMPELLADVHLMIAHDYFDLLNIDSAIWHYEEVNRIGNDNKKAQAFNGLGNCYYYTGDSESAWKYYEKSLHFAKLSGLTEKMSVVYNNFANILGDQNADQKALEYYKKALAHAPDSLLKAHFCNNIGLCYQKIDSLDIAITWYTKSKEIYELINEKRFYLTPLYNIALIQFDKKQYDKAMDSYLNMIDECIELDLKEDLIHIYNRLGLIYNILGKHHKSLHYHNKCIELAKETKFRLTSDYYGDIARTYDSLGHYKQALFYIKKHNALKDSLFSVEKEKTISELIASYEAKEKTAEINRLEVEKEKLAMKVRQEAFVRYSVIIITLIVIILTLTLLILYRKKLSIERQMAIHKEESIKRQEAEKRHQNNINIMKVSIQAQEKEKQRIASHLHDSVAGTLAGIKQSLGNLSNASSANNELKLALKYIDNAYMEVSTLSNHLIHLPSIEKNFISTLRKYCQDISELNRIKVSFKASGIEESTGFDQKLSQELFRIVQEAVNNILKHAKASMVEVCLSTIENKLLLTITDNGIGFESSETDGFGLQNIRSRVDLIKGKMTIKTAPGKGTKISIEIPEGFSTSG